MRKSATSTTVRATFVVERIRFVGGVDPEYERTTGYQHRGARDVGPARGQRSDPIEQRRPRPQVQCLKHGLVVLILVTDDESELNSSPSSGSASSVSSALFRTVAQ